MRQRYGDALYEKLGFISEEQEYHLFSVDIESAAFAAIHYREWVRKVWKAA